MTEQADQRLTDGAGSDNMDDVGHGGKPLIEILLLDPTTRPRGTGTGSGDSLSSVGGNQIHSRGR